MNTNQNAPEGTKTCPHCAESIKRHARVCPYCRQWQRTWSLFNPRLAPPLFTLCFAALGLTLIVVLQRLAHPEPRFEGFRNDVSVMSSSLAFGGSGGERVVIVIGTITNRSAFTWKKLELECRYFNANGDLIDAKTQFTSLAVIGNDEIAFRIETKQIRPESDYVKHRAMVRYAANGRAWP